MSAGIFSKSTILRLPTLSIIVFSAAVFAMTAGATSGDKPAGVSQELDKDYTNYGVVESIKLITLDAKSATLLGIKVNDAGKKMDKSVYFHVTVRLNSGAMQTITQKTVPNVKTGDRVMIENNKLFFRT